MRRHNAFRHPAAAVIAIALALAAAASAIRTASAATPSSAELFNGAEINWQDARAGIYEAANQHRPVIMVFHAPWCGVCKRFRTIFRDPRIVTEARNFVMILIDVDKDRSLNGAFSPDGTYVPRTLFIDPNGDVSKDLVGKDPAYPHTINPDSPDELLAIMKKAKAIGFGGLKPDDAPDDRSIRKSKIDSPI